MLRAKLGLPTYLLEGCMIMGFRGELRELPAVPRSTPSVSVLRLASCAGDDVMEEGGRHVQATMATQAFELPDGTTINRAPKDMRSWEIHATYRLAWHLAYFLPSARLAQALANWLWVAQSELERRGEWQPESLPPQSM
jgi:hypothetical protein